MSPARQGLFSTLLQSMRTPVAPGGRGYLRLGWLLLLLLAAQVISGILLGVYYRPTPELARESVAYVMSDVRWGWLIRGIHHWSALGVLAVAGLQLVRVLVTGAYRGERRSSWTLGLLLLVLFVVMAITGDLLPWDATARVTAQALLADLGAVPWVGGAVAHALRGGQDVGAPTLGRAYALHVLILPTIAAVLIVLQLWLLALRRRRRREEESR